MGCFELFSLEDAELLLAVAVNIVIIIFDLFVELAV
jgi:hypothetical protein